ncbi:MAG: aminoacetone oxidase family FAD-binding enzyme [Eubacteriales bacterium]|nr:aminoacetone oxidase family FAD-binding enzyme [Eubacteriales bacterium]
MTETTARRPRQMDLVVVGGGAAGLTAAISAARTWQEQAGPAKASPLKILILEKNDKIGRKILATGNGRCNLTNALAVPAAYHGQDPRFCRGALHRYDVRATLDLFLDLGLVCREEGDGRIYPVCQQAAAVVDLLAQEIERLHITVQTKTTVVALDPVEPVYLGNQPLEKEPHWRLSLADGQLQDATCVILATGGMASPNLGSDGSGYQLAQRLGHHLVEPLPALVQLTTAGRKTVSLSGIRVECGLSLMLGAQEIGRESGEVLFTEYGLSGIPILQLSRTVSVNLHESASETMRIQLDLLPEWTESAIETKIAQRISQNPALHLPDLLTGLVHRKIGAFIVREALHTALDQPVRILSSRQVKSLARTIKQLELTVTGTKDFSQAQVTAGGLDCRDFLPDRLESRLKPGLFAAGELLDIDGDCGGFNLQWAWSSGLLAGASAARLLLRFQP